MRSIIKYLLYYVKCGTISFEIKTLEGYMSNNDELKKIRKLLVLNGLKNPWRIGMKMMSMRRFATSLKLIIEKIKSAIFADFIFNCHDFFLYNRTVET